MSYHTAIIECVANKGDVFPQTIRGDIVFYPVNKTQKFMFGCEKHVSPTLTMTQNKSEINGPSLHIEALMHIAQNATCHNTTLSWTQKDKKQGALSTFSNKWGLFLHQLADPHQLEKTQNTKHKTQNTKHKTMSLPPKL